MFDFLEPLMAFEVPNLPLEEYWEHISDKIDQAYKTGTYKGRLFSEHGGAGSEQAAKDLADFFSVGNIFGC